MASSLAGAPFPDIPLPPSRPVHVYCGCYADDEGGIRARFSGFDIAARLREGGGLAVIDHFLPEHVAEVALELLSGNPPLPVPLGRLTSPST